MSQYSQSCLVVFLSFFTRIAKVVGVWSHITDVGKMRIFHRTTEFVLMNCYLRPRSKLILPSRYFSLSLFQVITVGAGRRAHHCDRWCKYTLLSRANEKEAAHSVAVAAASYIHYQMQITVTHSDKSSLFSFFKHNRQLRGWVFSTSGLLARFNPLLRVSRFLPPPSSFIFVVVLFQGIEF